MRRVSRYSLDMGTPHFQRLSAFRKEIVALVEYSSGVGRLVQ
jgi:hypothetical protein